MEAQKLRFGSDDFSLFNLVIFRFHVSFRGVDIPYMFNSVDHFAHGSYLDFSAL